jgi:hypothetical protein
MLAAPTMHLLYPLAAQVQGKRIVQDSWHLEKAVADEVFWTEGGPSSVGR